jgi:hypothetical protein
VELLAYMRAVKPLDFFDEPDYDALVSLFQAGLARLSGDTSGPVFDWDSKVRRMVIDCYMRY